MKIVVASDGYLSQQKLQLRPVMANKKPAKALAIMIVHKAASNKS